jgi:hypothetical protein
MDGPSVKLGEIIPFIDDREMMEQVKIAVVLFLVVAVVVLMRLKRRPLGYRRVDSLVTASERRFFSVLEELLPKGYRLFAKVRVADVILPQKSSDRSRWRAAFNKVACKHFDYVVCDERLRIVFAVELDDASHQKKERRERDRFLEWACRSAGVELLRVPLAKHYDKAALKKRIAKICHSHQMER